MAIFDAELWRSRAQSRYERALDAGTPKAVAAKKLADDVIHIDALGRLVKWCSERGIIVNFCACKRGGIYWPDDKTIKVNDRFSPEKQVFFLSHECGHHLIGDVEKHERFGMGYPQHDPAIKRTFHHRCDIVDEELEAWHRGYKLSRRLRIPLNKVRFDKTRTAMIKSYFVWALKLDGRRRKKDDDEKKTSEVTS